ncbi:MAG TPA: PEGA domain-containing protein [Vicinamibacterales bacterium]|nr:PEGA domain-containing protein [Vicinamibacterales bacterium]
MDAAARLDYTSPFPVTFDDGLGQRHRAGDPGGGPGTDVLVLRPSLAAVPSFEFALRERATRLASFRHSSYCRVRSVDRTSGPEPLLRLVADASHGLRLSDVLSGAHARQVPIDINAALCLVRQLVPAVAMLHESARDVAHGALAPERLVVTPHARLQVVEYVLGAALEQLRYSRERYWNELRIPVPAGPGSARLDHRADVLQIGVIALSLILGRALRPEEFPNRIADVVASTWAVSPRGGFEPLPPGLRGWLGRALQIDPVRSFATAVEARAELDVVLGDGELVASPASLEAFLTRYHASAPPVERPVPPHDPRERVDSPPPADAPATTGDAARLFVAVAAPVPPLPRMPAGRTTAGPSDDSLREVLALAASTVSLPEHDEPSALESTVSTETLDADADAQGPEPIVGEPGGPAWWRNWRLLGAAAAVVAVIAAGSSLGARRDTPDPRVDPASRTLDVSTSRTGARPLVDGVPRGSASARATPPRGAAAAALARTPSLAVPAVQAVAVPSSDPASSSGGMVSLDSPIDLQVFESGTLLGSSRDRLLLPAGRHALELVNADLGVRTSVVAEVGAGGTVTVVVPVPTGVISVNAEPAADVWLDGEKVGETPIGDLQLRVGSHDVVLRHPELGERHVTAVVTAAEPLRLNVDLRTK